MGFVAPNNLERKGMLDAFASLLIYASMIPVSLLPPFSFPHFYWYMLQSEIQDDVWVTSSKHL